MITEVCSSLLVQTYHVAATEHDEGHQSKMDFTINDCQFNDILSDQGPLEPGQCSTPFQMPTTTLCTMRPTELIGRFLGFEVRKRTPTLSVGMIYILQQCAISPMPWHSEGSVQKVRDDRILIASFYQRTTSRHISLHDVVFSNQLAGSQRYAATSPSKRNTGA
jgi:hypothetical protein